MATVTRQKDILINVSHSIHPRSLRYCVKLSWLRGGGVRWEVGTVNTVGIGKEGSDKCWKRVTLGGGSVALRKHSLLKVLYAFVLRKIGASFLKPEQIF